MNIPLLQLYTQKYNGNQHFSQIKLQQQNLHRRKNNNKHMNLT